MIAVTNVIHQPNKPNSAAQGGTTIPTRMGQRITHTRCADYFTLLTPLQGDVREEGCTSSLVLIRFDSKREEGHVPPRRFGFVSTAWRGGYDPGTPSGFKFDACSTAFEQQGERVVPLSPIQIRFDSKGGGLALPRRSDSLGQDTTLLSHFCARHLVILMYID
jgi:hypothetical protein